MTRTKLDIRHALRTAGILLAFLVCLLTLCVQQAHAQRVVFGGVVLDVTLNDDGTARINSCEKDSVGTLNLNEKIDEHVVTSIAAGAFEGCSGIDIINLSTLITSIGDNTFKGCTGLMAIGIPGNITSIGKDAFSGCRILEELEIPASVTTIGAGAFAGCSKLGGNPNYKITIPGALTYLGDGAFNGCASLKEARIPNTLTSIGKNMFAGCSTLATIIIPDSITSIESDAFSGCSKLVQVILPDSVTKLGDRAFKDCSSLSYFVIPAAVNSIGMSALEGCASLKSITVDSGNLHYESDSGVLFEKGKARLLVFPSAYASTSYTIPSGVTSIDDGAFKGAKSLEQVVIGSGLKKIGSSAFAGCSKLNTISLVTVEAIGSNAFEGCTGLKSIRIPSTLVKIESGTFKNCTGLTELKMPIANDTGKLSILKEIGDEAFSGCTGISSVTIPCTVETIGSGAFKNCADLSKVTFEYLSSNPGSLSTIKSEAFYGCDKLTAILLPASLAAIGDRAFDSNLGDVYFRGTQAQWDRISIGSNNPALKAADVHPNAGKIADASYVAATSATCAAPGYKAHYEREDKWFEDQACTKPIKNRSAWISEAQKPHTNKTVTTQASFKADGKVIAKCQVCGNEQVVRVIPRVAAPVLSQVAFTYNGKVQKPAVTLIDTAGNTIPKNSYTLDYGASGKDVGAYSIKVTLKGEYKDSDTVTYQIDPKGTKVKKLLKAKKALTVKWTKVSTKMSKTRIGGYQVRYSLKANMKSAKTKTVKGYKKTSVKIKKLKAKKKYYVQTRTYMKVGGKTYYSAWSKAKSAKTK